jgi:putative membrane protein
MIVSHKVSIHRIIAGTWKHSLVTVAVCLTTFLLFYFFDRPEYDIPAFVPSIIGTALAFFIGFNNNQAYDRWWEARKIWGALVNNSRSWARQLIYFSDRKQEGIAVDLKIKTLIYRHISFLFALKQVLRKSKVKEYNKYLSDDDVAFVESESNIPNAILAVQTKGLNELYETKVIDGFKFLELNKMLISFSDEMGKSERIKNTVFPTSYNYYTRIFIWVLIIFIILFSAPSLGAWSILIGTLIGYVFLTTQKIGLSLLNPFDEIVTGIPLDNITRTIEINLLEALKEKDIPKPTVSTNKEYLM